MQASVFSMVHSPLKALAWVLGVLLVLGIAMESWRYSVKPSSAENETFIENSLNYAREIYLQRQESFLEKSRELSDILQQQAEANAGRRTLHSVLENYPSFWGITLLKNGEMFAWNGFAGPSMRLGDGIIENQLQVRKNNNVIYWLYADAFTHQKESGETSHYVLYTSERIEQSNALPIADSNSYSLLSNFPSDLLYPVQLSFFNPLPENTLRYHRLNDTAGDSIGAVYALPGQIELSHQSWEEDTRYWRLLFMLLCFLTLSLALFLWLDRLKPWAALGSQLLLLGICWIITFYFELPSYWVTEVVPGLSQPDLANTYIQLTAFAAEALFLFLVAVTVHRKLSIINLQVEHLWYPGTILSALILGVLNTTLIHKVIYDSLQTSLFGDIGLMNLQMIPAADTLFYYLALSLLLFGAALLLYSLNKFLMRSGRDQQKLIATLIGTGYLLALMTVQLFVPDSIQLNWATLFASLYFGIILLTAYLFAREMPWLKQFSTVRLIVAGTVVISITGTAIIYNGYLTKQDRQLKQQAVSFSVESDPYARNMLRETLSSLEQQMEGITASGLKERIPFIQSELTSTIQEIISGNLRDYSVDIQLIDTTGSPVAGYSTSLKSPDWVRAFDISRLAMVTAIEQISRSNNRPIIQQPELIRKEDYSTFYRGWIPLFTSQSNEPVAWLLGSIYRERPDFNKPIRAVIASVTYSDWSSTYLLQEYNDRQLISSYKQGISGYFPKYNRLRDPEIEALSTENLIFYTSTHDDYTYRNMLWDMDPNSEKVIKASVIIPGFRNILFAFFRFSMVLLLAASVGALLLHLTGIRNYNLYGKEERFKNRILDNFLIATLVFLLMLVLTTHYAITQENENIVRQDLFDTLESLSQSTQNTLNEQSSANIEDFSFSLDSLVTPLNVDASFYRELEVTTSTTPQIYRQHLLPDILPFPVYYDLFQAQQRDALTRVALGSQELLIGYRSILSPDNRPVAAVAIPTFLQSPKYNQKLLETTSYLITFYLLIFGIFILGTTFISRQLTRPITFIQQGLNKISRGDLNTTIPVTSNDELGKLAEAYNEMVHRLKELQEELAVAEREAAWKEMAQQVAHEIKNPLTPMKLNVQHLERQLSEEDIDPEKMKARIKKITANLISQIQSLSNIASDFSKFSQPVEEEFEEIVLNDLIESVCDLYQHDDDISLDISLPEDQIIIEGVEDELRRVMINLIKNAFEAMPDGGTIHIRCYSQKQSAFIEVEDNGEGIPEEDKSRIFVPSFSTKSSGTGLGLAISKKVIESHQGSISFASIEGKGTTFIIKLPLKHS